VGISAGVVGYRGIQYAHRLADERAIAQLSEEFGQYMVQQRATEAYQLFDDKFKNRVSFDAFKAHLATLESGQPVAPITSITWNGLAEFQTDDDGVQLCNAMILLTYKDSDYIAREPAWFRKSGDTWQIEDLPLLFPRITHPDDNND
jgi:hypothetical protein